MEMSQQSITLDCDSRRLSRAAFSAACICTVKPSSFEACSAIEGIAGTGGPAWRSTTSLMFCAQIVGNPLTAPLQIAARASFSTARRVCGGRPLLERTMRNLRGDQITCIAANLDGLIQQDR